MLSVLTFLAKRRLRPACKRFAVCLLLSITSQSPRKTTSLKEVHLEIKLSLFAHRKIPAETEPAHTLQPSQLSVHHQPLLRSLLNAPTPATPGLCRVGVEARPAALRAGFGVAAEVDALVEGTGLG